LRHLFLILTVLLALTADKCRAELIGQELLPQLIHYSDNIVIGQITSVQDSTYTLTVLQTIKGKKFSSYVLKKDSRDLKPIYRWDKYKVGQTELAFISYDKLYKQWELTYSHGEAEMLINKDTIYLYSRAWVLTKNSERYPYNKINVDNCIFDGLPFNKNEMIQAIIDFSKQTKLLSKKMSKEKDILDAQDGNKPRKDDINLTDKTLIAFRDKSLSHKRLICELMDEPFLKLF
jgi:hypothetical protein